mgnify:CR=1 FL=1
MRLYWHLFPNFLVDFDSGKIEKEKKKVAQEAGFLRTEVTGGEVSDRNGKYFHGVKCGRFFLWLLEICWSYFWNRFNKVFFFLLKNQMAEETERERRIFQLQMCEVSSWCSNIHFIFNYWIHNAFIGDLITAGAVLSLEYIINVWSDPSRCLTWSKMVL